jgi:hypothetical protein
VFNDLIQNGQANEREVTLLDAKFEHSTAVSTFLGLVLESELHLPPLSKANQFAELVNLAEFLDKWACAVPRKTLVRALKDLSLTPRRSFAIGALVDDPDTRAHAITSHVKNHLANEEDFDDLGPLDLSLLPFKTYKRIPLEYQWALSKTCSAYLAVVDAVPPAKSVRSKFLKYLRQAQSSPGQPPPATPAKRTYESDDSDEDDDDDDDDDDDEEDYDDGYDGYDGYDGCDDCDGCNGCDDYDEDDGYDNYDEGGDYGDNYNYDYDYESLGY